MNGRISDNLRKIIDNNNNRFNKNSVVVYDNNNQDHPLDVNKSPSRISKFWQFIDSAITKIFSVKIANYLNNKLLKLNDLHNAYFATDEIQRILNNQQDDPIKLKSRITTVAKLQEIKNYLFTEAVNDNTIASDSQLITNQTMTNLDDQSIKNTALVAEDKLATTLEESQFEEKLAVKQEADRLIAETKEVDKLIAGNLDARKLALSKLIKNKLDKRKSKSLSLLDNLDERKSISLNSPGTLDKRKSVSLNVLENLDESKSDSLRSLEKKPVTIQSATDKSNELSVTQALNMKPNITTIFKVPIQDKENYYQETNLHEQYNQLVAEKSKLSKRLINAKSELKQLEVDISRQYNLEINRNKLLQLKKLKKTLDTNYKKLLRTQKEEDIISDKNKLDVAINEYNNQKQHYNSLLDKYNKSSDLNDARQKIDDLEAKLKATNQQLEDLR
jgi:hypothetical protein